MRNLRGAAVRRFPCPARASGHPPRRGSGQGSAQRPLCGQLRGLSGRRAGHGRGHDPADHKGAAGADLMVSVKEQTDGKVVVFTMGPPDAEKALRDAMALGCDESCLITDRAVAGGDTVATAKVLAKAIQLYGEFDLILGGALSADGATGQVAAMVAEELNLPHVVEIQSVKYKEDQAGKVEVVKKMHDTSFRIACATPAVLSVNFGCNEPRLATLRSKRAAKSKPLVTYTNAELGFAAEEVGIKGSPTVTVDSFQPETKRSAKMLTGTPAELAKQLYDLIEEEKGK